MNMLNVGTYSSTRLASQIYEAASDNVYVIQPAVPEFPQKNRSQLKDACGFAGKELITTFGLIGPGKGLEIAIRSLSKLVKWHRNLMYLIVGQTHPLLVKHEGERYQEMLVDLVIDLGLKDHVSFINQILKPEELRDYLYMTDIYLIPCPQGDKSISTTLAYALGCGRAIVSTPYFDAHEMIGQGEREMMALDTTSQSLAELLHRILSEPALKLKLEKRAANLGRKIKFPYIAQQYAMMGQSILKSKVDAV